MNSIDEKVEYVKAWNSILLSIEPSMICENKLEEAILNYGNIPIQNKFEMGVQKDDNIPLNQMNQTDNYGGTFIDPNQRQNSNYNGPNQMNQNLNGNYGPRDTFIDPNQRQDSNYNQNNGLNQMNPNLNGNYGPRSKFKGSNQRRINV
jgi:hypothetical protein